jgi:oligopeptide transport system substrate-binding protein
MFRQLLCAAFLLAGLASCHGDQAQQRAADTLYRVNEDELSSLDPQKVSTVIDTRVARDLFEGLTDYAADGSIVPGLATGWMVDRSGLIWTFTLRKDARFSDQSLITARDVAYSLRRLFTPAVSAPNASLLFAIRNAEAATKGSVPVDAIGVTAPDDLTVRITLERPFPALPEVLAHATAVVVPEKTIEKYRDDWTKLDHIVVSGAFKPVQWDMHSQLRLDKNNAYHRAATVALQHVIYLPISEDQTALRKYRAHEVDVLADFPTGRVDGLRKLHGTEVRIEPYRGSYYYVFNTRRKPFNDKNVRLALNLAVDRDIITRLVVPLGMRPAYSVVPPDLPGYGAPVMPAWANWPMPQRLAEARRLLAAAGVDRQHPLRFEVRYNSDDDHRRIALAMAEMWKPLGVQAVLFNSEASVHFANLRAHSFDMARSGWIADYSGADNFLGVYESNAGRLNYSGYTFPEFDQLLTTAHSEADSAKRNLLLRQAETMLLDDMPVLPLYFYVSRNLVSKDVRGWRAAPSGIHLSKYLSVEREKQVNR